MRKSRYRIIDKPEKHDVLTMPEPKGNSPAIHVRQAWSKLAGLHGRPS